MAATTFLLIRHAEHSLGPDVLPGRMTGVHLSERGRRDAEALARRLAHRPIRAVICSPRERTIETAQPLAAALELSIRTDEAFDEIEFGQWTGLRMDDLEGDPQWQRWNRVRTHASPPGGERMLTAQARVIAGLERLRDEHPDSVVAVFSHGDTIRAALADALGVHLDLVLRIEVALASVSVVVLDEDGPQVRAVNHTLEWSLPGSAGGGPGD